MTRTLVKIIGKKGASALVQYLDDGKLTRKYIPTHEIENGTVADEVLEQGIVHGHNWEDVAIILDSEKFADEMHNVDVWTAEDALKYPQRVTAALHATLAGNITNILEIASRERKGVRNGR